MKIMAVNRTIGSPFGNILPVDMIPDSAIIRDHKPFFIPEFASDWTFSPVIAFRIHRLGKNIAERFAPRYYDAYTLGLRIRPCDLLTELNSNNLPTGIATAFDGAFIQGEWMPLDIPCDKLSIDAGGLTADIDFADTGIDRTIAQLSRYFTFKIGDIVIPCAIPAEKAISINTSVTGTINGTECINFKIK